MAEEFGPTLGEATQGGIQVQFTEDSFNEALQTFGAENLANALVTRASSMIPEEYQFTYDDLKSLSIIFIVMASSPQDSCWIRMRRVLLACRKVCIHVG